MLRVKFKRSHKEHRRGDIISVTNNEAHALIEMGVADITTTTSNASTYEDKIMVSGFGRRYKTK